MPQFPHTQDEDDGTVSLSMVVRIILTHRTQRLSLTLTKSSVIFPATALTPGIVEKLRPRELETLV